MRRFFVTPGLRGKIVNLIPITPRHNGTWFLIHSQEEMWKRSGGFVLLFLFGLQGGDGFLCCGQPYSFILFHQFLCYPFVELMVHRY